MSRLSALRLRQLGVLTRFALGGLLISVLVAYAAIALSAYLYLTRPSSLAPDLGELQKVIFDTKKPISRIERLLESTTGEMNRGGTMRPAFTDESLDWESITRELTAAEKDALLSEREAERLILLDWVRSGADRGSYENNDYPIRDTAVVGGVMPAYRIDESQTARPRVRIRTLIEDRCVTCHGENGRHDAARYIALDTYDRLGPHLQPETSDGTARAWLIAALIGLYPLAVVSGSMFCFTGHPVAAKCMVVGTTIIALAVMTACWLCGRPDGFFLGALMTAAAVAMGSLLVQAIASVQELLTVSPPARE
jgi:hypothetical protein